MFSNPVTFKRGLELFSSPFYGCHICSEVFFVGELCHQANFDTLIQRCFWAIQKITINRKKLQEIIIYANLFMTS